jgi:cytochrome c556
MARKLITLALMLASAASFSPLAQAEPSSAVYADKRITINVTQAEKNQVLYEMREFLHGLQNINFALARLDMKAVAVTARPMGPLLDRMPASLKERLPEEFTQMAIAMNESFQTTARDAESKGMTQTHENMAEVMTYCSGCHDTYRFNVVPMKARK